MKKIIAWILLLIVLAGGVYWINKLSYKASPLVQDSITSTDSWKTYTDTPNGFEFKYPRTFEVLKYDNSILIVNSKDKKNLETNQAVDYVLINIVDNKAKLSAIDWWNRFGPYIPSRNDMGLKPNTFPIEKMTVGGIEGIYIGGSEGVLSNYLILPYKDKILEVNLIANESMDILSTLKFISTTAKPSITVLSPNGGEVWKIGSEPIISWISSDDIKDQSVELSLSGELVGFECRISDLVPISQNKFSLDLFYGKNCLKGKFFNQVMPGKYKVNIKVVNPTPTGIEDSSDNYFTIIDSPLITHTLSSEAQKNVYYYGVLDAKNFATSTLNWQIIDGKLPPGIFLQKAYVSCLPGGVGSDINKCGNPEAVMFKAQISGRPTQEGTYNFTIKVSNDTQSATKAYSISVKN